jgi:hypothetical protein
MIISTPLYLEFRFPGFPTRVAATGWYSFDLQNCLYPGLLPLTTILYNEGTAEGKGIS